MLAGDKIWSQILFTSSIMDQHNNMIELMIGVGTMGKLFNIFLDALASLELDMPLTGSQIFREILPSWYWVNRTKGQ